MLSFWHVMACLGQVRTLPAQVSEAACKENRRDF
jgi:hypothetical protein